MSRNGTGSPPAGGASIVRSATPSSPPYEAVTVAAPAPPELAAVVYRPVPLIEPLPVSDQVARAVTSSVESSSNVATAVNCCWIDPVWSVTGSGVTTTETTAGGG